MLPRLDWPYIIGARGSAPDDVLRALNHLRSLFGERIEALPPPVLERLLNFAPWDWRLAGPGFRQSIRSGRGGLWICEPFASAPD